jgi:PKD repeat protein/tetratricopeptide (TPR) repeat protein
LGAVLPGEESSSGPRSSTTAQIAFGSCTLEIGDAAGSRLALASTTEESTENGLALASTPDDSTESRPALASTQGDSRALRRAVAQNGKSKRRTPSEEIETAVESSSEVTSKVEHTLALLKDVASGSIDIDSLSTEADALLGLLQRLDRKKRWDDVLRVARCLAALLALLGRWIELLRSLRTALQAAEQLGDPLSEAWALHELGTLHLLAGRHAEADRQLGKAREIRRRCHSRDIAVTNNNLQVLCQTLRRLAPRRSTERMLDRLARRPALALILAATLIAVGAGAGAVLAHSSNREKPFHMATVAFSFVPSAPHTGQDIVFSATATDARDPVASYTWQWGDGDPAPERVQRHEYRATGRYKVVLTVRDAQGRTIGKIAQWVTIRRPRIENGPNAYFSFNPHSPTVGEPVLFDAGSSYDPRASIAGYEWSFGDGLTARSVTASHSFAQPRLYRVALTVTDTDGQHNTLVKMVAVTKGKGTFTVTRSKDEHPAETKTAIRCPSGPVPFEEAAHVSGSITPARSGVTVRVIYSGPSGESTTVDSMSNSAGVYETSFQPRQEGSWSVQSSQAESNGYRASSSEPCTFTVTRRKSEPRTGTRTTINCPGNPMVGEPVSVSGSVVPARPGAKVRVIFRGPSHQETPFNLTSSAEGTYNTSFTPKEPGVWTVQSSQAESSEYQASSATCTFTAEELD